MTRHLDTGPLTVLLVQPAHDDRQMYAEYLRNRQFCVVELDDTADAFARARTAALVITEVRVPGPFDGVELVRRLRADDRTKDTPVIVLTASVSEPDRQRAHAAGCDVFLSKPCLPQTLSSEIRRVLALRLIGPPAGAKGDRRRFDVA